MPHPSLGLPPADVTAGHPEAAARLRANITRLARLGLQETVNNADGFADRYDEDMLRLLLRDSERHLEQLAKVDGNGRDYYVTSYAEWLVPDLSPARRPDARRDGHARRSPGCRGDRPEP